jgi:hypothetical protein
MLHILQDSLLPYILLDPPLRLDIIRVRIERCDLALLSEFRIALTFPVRADELSKAFGVVLDRVCEFGLSLWWVG